MPYAPAKPCRAPGCAALLPRGGYCPAHAHLAPSRAYDARRYDSEAATFRRSTAWRTVSELVRSRHPLCCDPFGHHGEWPAASQQVHHIAGVRARPDLALDPDNLAAVCVPCHARLEAMERRGQPTAHLFAGKTAGEASP